MFYFYFTNRSNDVIENSLLHYLAWQSANNSRALAHTKRR